MSCARWGLLSSLVVLCACTERARPDPVNPDSTIELSAVLLEPQTSATVVAGTTLDVRVRAAEPASRLSGIGFVARLFGNNGPPLDSVVVRFATVADTTHVFQLQLPADLATNTQVDISGLAFGPAQQTARSAVRSIVIIGCPAGGAICR